MNNPNLTRRRLMQAGLVSMSLPAVLSAAAPHVPALRFRLTETAGLRRFGYPVATLLSGPKASTRFRLTRGGKPVPAQFRAVTDDNGQPAIALDFNASPGPLETEEYTVEYGDDIEPGPEPKAGLRVEHVAGVFRVANGPGLRFEVPDNLRGFLRAVGSPAREYVRGDSTGLEIGGKQATARLGEGLKARVIREGPIAVALRFEGPVTIGADRVQTVVQLTFRNSKSWVETNWTVHDPGGVVTTLRADQNLVIEGAPTLADLGASSTVYGELRGSDIMTLSAGPGSGDAGRWQVRKGDPSHPPLFATAPDGGGPPAEGWAHVMDRARCTAAAVANFGKSTRDEIEVRPAGLALVRTYADGGRQADRKWLRFWLHFVPMPVQVGAATSPQAMLAPLQVEWLPAPA